MAAKTTFERVAFSPGEFAELFGKSQTWGYRQIYAGKVKAITEHGRTLIPAAEVDAILKTAGIYNGSKPKPLKTKADIQNLAPQLQDAWKNFLVARRRALAPSKNGNKAKPSKPNWPTSTSARQDAMKRLTGQSRKSRD